MRADILLRHLRDALRDARERQPDRLDRAALVAWGEVYRSLAQAKHGDKHEAEIEAFMREWQQIFLPKEPLPHD